MNKPKPKAAPAAPVPPTIGKAVVVRSPFFQKPTAGIVVDTYGADTNDVIIVAFPVGRESLQIPSIPYFAEEPDASERSAVWPA
jgi:hypothetical protein